MLRNLAQDQNSASEIDDRNPSITRNGSSRVEVMRNYLNALCLLAAFVMADPLLAQQSPTPTLTVRGTGVAADEKSATKAAIEKALSGVIEIVLDAPARKKHA